MRTTQPLHGLVAATHTPFKPDSSLNLAQVVLLGIGHAAEASMERPRQRGVAQVEETRPKLFPHRIWAPCDFEARTPDS